MLEDLQEPIRSTIAGQHEAIGLRGRHHLHLTMDPGNLIDVGQGCIARKEDFLIRPVLEDVLKEGLPGVDIKTPGKVGDIGGDKLHKALSSALWLGSTDVFHIGTKEAHQGEITGRFGNRSRQGDPRCEVRRSRPLFVGDSGSIRHTITMIQRGVGFRVGGRLAGFTLTPFPRSALSVCPPELSSFGIRQRLFRDDAPMPLNLESMRRTITSGQALGIWAFVNRAMGPLPSLPVPIRKMMAWMAAIPGHWKRFKILDSVIRGIVVFVMDVKAFWHRAIVLLPVPNVVRFAAAIFKTFPFRGLERFERITGGFPTLVMERAPSSRNREIGTTWNLTGRSFSSVHG